MSSFEMNRLQSISGVSPASAADRAKARSSSEAGVPGAGGVAGSTNASAVAGAAATGVAVEITAPSQSGPPVDTDRVAQIRDALREGSYPLVPAKIADAMIAAQLKFEIE
ncbi:MAG: flagellar biosynthesis anti-sigma factor FlgM [Erythrobacter sp.]|uniref:flagellar biosynthesis anti-sigma factor FlgM n=1 Tax=Erythrobacter sp. TaxID=1042 RepID=UPI00329A4BAF